MVTDNDRRATAPLTRVTSCTYLQPSNNAYWPARHNPHTQLHTRWEAVTVALMTSGGPLGLDASHGCQSAEWAAAEQNGIWAGW